MLVKIIHIRINNKNNYTMKKIEITEYSSNEPILMTERDLQVFFDAINNPKPPSENLKRLYEKYKEYLKN